MSGDKKIRLGMSLSKMVRKVRKAGMKAMDAQLMEIDQVEKLSLKRFYQQLEKIDLDQYL